MLFLDGSAGRSHDLAGLCPDRGGAGAGALADVGDIGDDGDWSVSVLQPT